MGPSANSTRRLIIEGLQEVVRCLEELRDHSEQECEAEPLVCTTCFQEADGCLCPSASFWPINQTILKVRTELTLLQNGYEGFPTDGNNG